MTTWFVVPLNHSLDCVLMQLPHTRVACTVYSALADSAEQKEAKALTEALVDIVEQLKLIVPGASLPLDDT